MGDKSRPPQKYQICLIDADIKWNGGRFQAANMAHPPAGLSQSDLKMLQRASQRFPHSKSKKKTTTRQPPPSPQDSEDTPAASPSAPSPSKGDKKKKGNGNENGNWKKNGNGKRKKKGWSTQ